MSKVSDVIVRWTPELSTRAIATQIESRIKGESAWTEQANGIDPDLGIFRFTSNAPGAVIEVRMRFRSDTGVYDDWVIMEVQTTDIVTFNAELEQAVRDAAADAKAAKDRYAEMAADDKFDPVEKQEVRIKLAEYAKEVARWTAQATNAGIVTEKSNYQAAYDALVSYLNANGINSLNTTNAINRTEFTAKFTDYIDKRSLLITAIAEKGSKTADYGQITNRPGSLRDINSGEYNTISLNSTDAIARANAAKAIIDAVIDNNVLDRAEKPGVIQDWAEIVFEQAILSLQASDRGVSFTPVSDAKNALANYLGSLSPAWDNPNVDTPINRDTYKARWTDYYTARTNLIAQIDKKAIQREDQLFSGLDKISSDGWLDRSEKADVILRWRSLNDRQTIAVNRYNDLGGPSNSTGFRDTAGARISDLANYLGGLSPTWNDRTTDTPINRTDFDNAWANAIKAVQAFEISLVGNTSSEIRQSIAILQLANQDGYWTIAEKIGDIIPHDASLEALYQQLMSQSAPFAGESVVASARSAAGTARSNWTNYRDSVRPFWNDKTQASQIDRTTADARLREYELALDAVGLSITKYVDTRASFAVDRLASISSDSVLDMSEKYKTVIEWQALNAEYNSFNVKRAALNYPAETNSAANRAYNAIDPNRSGSLGQYLGNLSPAWNDSTTNTPINANDWKNKWIEALSAMGEYRAAITGQKGDKGDPGTSTTTEPTSGQTSYSGQSLYHGWRGPAASLSLNAGQTATIELALYLSSNQGVNVTGYIQCFNASDQHVANVNNAAVYVNPGEPEQLYVAGNFTNNSGTKQTYNFHGHSLLSPQINITAGGGSYISVRK